MEIENTLNIGIIGGGPNGLFMLKRLLEQNWKNLNIHIFEKKDQLGAGMPYSVEGASVEHITNVSDNEIPQLISSIADWVIENKAEALKYDITAENFNEYKVLPRLFFGNYLSSQFNELLKKAAELNIPVTVYKNTIVDDVVFNYKTKEITILTAQEKYNFQIGIICVGHCWPKTYEDRVQGYFDSPYPPKKLSIKVNHAVALKGSSLTAIDAIRTLARSNGKYIKLEDGSLVYQLDKGSENFKMIMHSRNGLLPAVRFHLDDSQLKNKSILTEEEIFAHRKTNHGFLSLDYIFEKDFKNLFIEKDKTFYEKIKDLSIEDFVDLMMKQRENANPFQLLKAEYLEAEKSIEKKKSIYWKEALGILSFAMNQPAKHFSAEDFQRLKSVLMPLISIVIAYVPQSSCEELLALYDAGVLDLISVGDDNEIIPEENGGVTYQFKDENDLDKAIYFPLFINCVGQPQLPFEKFPFSGLLDGQSLSHATYQFQFEENGLAALKENPDEVEFYDEKYYLKVSGLAINDSFQVIDKFGAFNPNIYIMAIPYISGYNPDYSGLDFCEAATMKVIEGIEKNFEIKAN